MTPDDIRLMLHVTLLGGAALLVDLAGLMILAWHHDTMVLPLVFALFLTLGSTLVMAYRLGKERR